MPSASPAMTSLLMRAASVRPLVAARIFLLFIPFGYTSPAESCHIYSRWRYPWPQRCGVPVKFVARVPERKAPPVKEFPIPDLSNVDWGHAPDEHTVGIIRIRVELEKQRDR